MNYTILSTIDLQTNQELELIKDSNTYIIGLLSEDKTKYYNIRVKKIETAQKIYQNIITLFINGWYSYDERINKIREVFYENRF